MTTQLSIYNGACLALGETALTGAGGVPTEARESKFLLDSVWDGTAGLADCLSDGFWKFAIRSIQWSYDPSVTTSFGLRYAFSVPTDYVRTYACCSDPYFAVPYLDYRMEGRDLAYSDLQTMYLRYVSSDVNFGLNLSNWTLNFTRYVELYFAWRISPKILQSQAKVDALEKRMNKMLTEARSLDAMENPTEQPAVGSWVRSRFGRRSGWDRGNVGRLIG